MDLPIDTNPLTCICASPGRPRLKWGTTEQEINSRGERVFETGVMVSFNGRSEVIAVRSTSEPPAMSIGQVLRLEGLVCAPWELQDGRHGVNHWATRIEPAARTGAKEAS